MGLYHYNKDMAKGWESKSVESQIESFEAGRRAARKQASTPEQMERERQKGSIALTRKRVLHDLEQCRNPRYRKMLEESLAYLDAKLAEFK